MPDPGVDRPWKSCLSGRGTRFVGRYLAAELLGRGHALTCFHRGKTNPELFPEAERIFGDRDAELDRLGDESWDVVVDACAYPPEPVEAAVDYLADRVERYVYVSSAAVYESTDEPGLDGSSTTPDGAPRARPEQAQV